VFNVSTLFVFRTKLFRIFVDGAQQRNWVVRVLRSGRRRLVEHSVVSSSRWIMKWVNRHLKLRVTRRAWQSCNAMEEYLLARNR
jgi:hypothetical protein